MERLLRLYRDWSGAEPASSELLPLSGSARKYYRMSGEGGTVIGCIGTNPAENRAFLALDAQFCDRGLHAPAVAIAITAAGKAMRENRLIQSTNVRTFGGFSKSV